MNDFISAFQAKHGLGADGVIGKNTLLKIKSVYMIPTVEATAHFVGNTYHETGGYTRFSENLNYKAKRLVEVFPRYFESLAIALPYDSQPEKIGNRIYSSRMGNGNEASGDGYKFRGRGALQTTGKTNYTLLGKYLNADLIAHPELVADQYAFESAAFFFTSNNLWTLAATVDDASIAKVRKKVNGGAIGLEDVNAKVKYFYGLITKK